jgi:hypothetical protein
MEVVFAPQVPRLVDCCIDDKSASLQSNECLNDVIFNQPFSDLNRRLTPFIACPRFDGGSMQHEQTFRFPLMNLHMLEFVH